METLQFEAKTVNSKTSAAGVQEVAKGDEGGIEAFQASWSIDRTLKKIQILRAYWSFDTQGEYYKLYVSHKSTQEPKFTLQYEGRWSSKPKQRNLEIPDFQDVFAADSGTGWIRFVIKRVSEADGAPADSKAKLTVSNVKLNIEYEILQQASQFEISSKTVTTNINTTSFPRSQIRMTVIPGSNLYNHTVTIADPDNPSGEPAATYTFNKLSGSQSQNFIPTDGIWLQKMPNTTQLTTRLTYKCFDETGTLIDTKEQDIVIKCREYNEETNAIKAYIHKIPGNTYTDPLTQAQTYFLQNWSTLIVTASSSSANSGATFTGYCGSWIESATITCGPASRTTNPSHNSAGYSNPEDIKLEVGTIAKVGQTPITVVLTDSRGKKRTLQDSITVSSYSPPYVSRFIVGRCGADFKPDAANKYGFAVCEPVIQKKIGNGTAENNSATISYYDRVPDPDNLNTGLLYSRREYYDADSKRYYVDVFCTDNTYNTLKEFNAAQSFTIYAFVKDAVGGYCATKAIIPTGAVFMSWRKNVNSIGFGGIPDHSNAVYVANNMRLMWGKEYVMPANYLKVRPTSAFQVSSGEHELLLQTVTQQDQNNLFSLVSRTESGTQRTVIVCNTDCYAEFSGNVYLGNGFNTSSSGDFSVLLRIAGQANPLGLARIRPWTSAMYCTFAIAPRGIALHPGDEISVSVLGSSSASGTIQQANNYMETYITVKAIDFIAAANS